MANGMIFAQNAKRNKCLQKLKGQVARLCKINQERRSGSLGGGQLGS